MNAIIQRDPEVIAAEADRDLIMVSVATGHYYGLSNVAREIWDAIERPKRVSDLVEDLTAYFGNRKSRLGSQGQAWIR